MISLDTIVYWISSFIAFVLFFKSFFSKGVTVKRLDMLRAIFFMVFAIAELLGKINQWF